MTDAQPILCDVVLGALRPANDKARETLRALGNGARVSVEVKKATANKRRLDFYWTMIGVAAENLSEKVPGLTPEDLHGILKQKLELGRWIELPSGDRVFRAESISFSRMTEDKRAEYINRVDRLLSGWLGVPPGTILDEARLRAA